MYAEALKSRRPGSYYNRNSSDDTCARRDIGQGLVNYTASKIIATSSFYNFCPTTGSTLGRSVTYIHRAVGCSFSVCTSFLLLFFFRIIIVHWVLLYSHSSFRCYYLHHYYHKMDLCFFSTYMDNDNNISHRLFRPTTCPF